MRSWTLFALAVVGALGGVTALGQALSLPSVLTVVLFGLVVAATGLAAKALADRRRSARRTNAEGGIERDIAQRAAARTLLVALLILVALGTWLALDESYGPAALCYLGLVLVIIAHWIIYAVDRRRTLSATATPQP